MTVLLLTSSNRSSRARLRAKWLAREARLAPLGQNAHAANKYKETDALQA